MQHKISSERSKYIDGLHQIVLDTELYDREYSFKKKIYYKYNVIFYPESKLFAEYIIFCYETHAKKYIYGDLVNNNTILTRDNKLIHGKYEVEYHNFRVPNHLIKDFDNNVISEITKTMDFEKFEIMFLILESFFPKNSIFMAVNQMDPADPDKLDHYLETLDIVLLFRECLILRVENNIFVFGKAEYEQRMDYLPNADKKIFYRFDQSGEYFALLIYKIKKLIFKLGKQLINDLDGIFVDMLKKMENGCNPIDRLIELNFVQDLCNGKVYSENTSFTQMPYYGALMSAIYTNTHRNQPSYIFAIKQYKIYKNLLIRSLNREKSRRNFDERNMPEDVRKIIEKLTTLNNDFKDLKKRLQNTPELRFNTPKVFIRFL